VRRRALATALAAASLSLALSGCDGSGLFRSGSGFVSGSGEVKVLPDSGRRAPDPIAGTTLDGKDVSLAEYKGKIVVMPVWGSWCGPCRAEAPMLQAAYQDLRSQGVEFLGINSRDVSPTDPLAFARNIKMTYPSIYNPSGSLLLHFNAGMSPSSIPGFAFIDEQGRVAAVVVGELTRTTLYDVIEDVRK
jgi:thiol-disulfide isomerase/thioredoxin